ncbi:Peroxisomal and mitochondrial division factor 2 [Abeliophyllum distichum]|uniref:Peroxisomal and mitochondrial division factor 2 n=1 Tax=Abeliophyllum distichum TaxID=126358 RepID=A0ABD1PRX0_9LAMI
MSWKKQAGFPSDSDESDTPGRAHQFADKGTLMADETMINGEYSDDRMVEITEDESSSSKISGLSQKLAGLEQENNKMTAENKKYKERIEELTASVKDSDAKNVELTKQVESAESESKALGAVAARAAELEAEVSQLQHDLVSAMSDLQESNVELSEVKRDLEEMKGRDKEKDVKLAAIEKERDLFVVKVKELEENKSDFRNEMEGKEKEIRSLKKKVEELEAVVVKNEGLEKLKNELEKKVDEMEGKIRLLESKLDEEEKVKERLIMEGVNGGINRETVVDGEKKGLIGNLKERDWTVVVGSAVGAVSVLGVACYLRHASRKQ